MAKVKSPLMSKKASGNFGKVLQFRCGKFLVFRKKIKEKESTPGENLQREKFKDGVDVWKNILTTEQRNLWESFAKSVRHELGYFTLNVPFGPIYVQIGRKEKWKECIQTGGYNGYQYFLCCYLRFGPDGWNDYPNPPPFP